jgi:polyketide synthase PksJ
MTEIDICSNFDFKTVLIPTLNKQGWMIDKIVDDFTEEFINFASRKNNYSLEIAAAYGNVSLEVLKKGGKIIANDLDKRHLDILYEKTPNNLRENLRLLAGSCLSDLNLTLESIAAVYCSRVFHFFTSDEILETLKKLHILIEKNGKIFIVADSIYHGYNKDNFNNYLRKKHLKIKNPSLLKPHEYIFHEDPEMQEEMRNNMPNIFNLMDIDTMSALLSEAGFLTEKAGYFSRKGHYPNESLWHGKEGLGIIAVKP